MDIFKAIIMTVFQILGFVAFFVAIVVSCGGVIWLVANHPFVIAYIICGFVVLLAVVALFLENLNKLKSKHDN